MPAQKTPQGIANARANLVTGRRKEVVTMRQLAADAYELEQLVVNCCRKKPNNALALSALVRVFVSLVPLLRALQGKPLMLHGSVSVTKRLNMTPKEAARQLKALKPITLAHSIEDAPLEPAQEPANDAKQKGIS